MLTKIINTDSLSLNYDDYLLRNICSSIELRDVSDHYYDFLQISKYQKCAVFGEDFNSVFVLRNSTKNEYNLSIALTGDAAFNGTEAVHCILINLCNNFEDLRVYVNKSGFFIKNIVINRKKCVIHIENKIYSDAIKICEQMPFASQEMCFFNGDFYVSNSCKQAMNNGEIVVQLNKHRPFYEELLFEEFLKGFSIRLPDFSSAINEKSIDTIEKLINFLNPEKFIKISYDEIITLPNVFIIPEKSAANSADCSVDSWVIFSQRPRASFLHQNEYFLINGDPENFYISVKIDENNLFYFLDYESKYSSDLIENTLKAFADIDSQISVVEKYKKNLNLLEENTNTYAKQNFTFFKKPANSISVAEEWYGEYYYYKF